MVKLCGQHQGAKRGHWFVDPSAKQPPNDSGPRHGVPFFAYLRTTAVDM